MFLFHLFSPNTVIFFIHFYSDFFLVFRTIRTRSNTTNYPWENQRKENATVGSIDFELRTVADFKKNSEKKFGRPKIRNKNNLSPTAPKKL